MTAEDYALAASVGFWQGFLVALLFVSIVRILVDVVRVVVEHRARRRALAVSVSS